MAITVKSTDLQMSGEDHWSTAAARGLNLSLCRSQLLQARAAEHKKTDLDCHNKKPRLLITFSTLPYFYQSESMIITELHSGAQRRKLSSWVFEEELQLLQLQCWNDKTSASSFFLTKSVSLWHSLCHPRAPGVNLSSSLIFDHSLCSSAVLWRRAPAPAQFEPTRLLGLVTRRPMRTSPVYHKTQIKN